MPDIRFQIANPNSPGPSECEGPWPVPRNAYDAENRLVSATSLSMTNGALRVLNAYDHRHRRIRKTVQHLTVTMPPAPSPPSETYEWNTVETHTFVWDGDDIVLERIAFTNGTSRVCEYFWGPDMSGAEQGAGGVGGLLAVSMDGVFYIPCYDHNGNIVWYVSEFGAVAAEYVYDPYGNVVETTGALAEQFSFGFSTKPLDHETGLVDYQRRFHRPVIGRWINRDPIEEEGGENLYAFCRNSPNTSIDRLGKNIYLVTGNDTGFYLNDHFHQSICVDDGNSLDGVNKKTCFSFGYIGIDCFLPKRTWLGWYDSTLGGLLMKGEVYETVMVGEITATKITTKAQDMQWLKWMRSSRKGLTDVYSFARHNCRRYSQYEFHDAPGVIAHETVH